MTLDERVNEVRGRLFNRKGRADKEGVDYRLSSNERLIIDLSEELKQKDAVIAEQAEKNQKLGFELLSLQAKYEGLYSARQKIQRYEKALEDAKANILYLRKMAQDEKDSIYIVGYSDCMLEMKQALTK